MFERDAGRRKTIMTAPKTCGHPIYTQILMEICHSIRMFLPAKFMYLYPQDDKTITINLLFIQPFIAVV